MSTERPSYCADCAQWPSCEGTGRLKQEVRLIGIGYTRAEIDAQFVKPCVSRVIGGGFGVVERPAPPKPKKEPLPEQTMTWLGYEPTAEQEAQLFAEMPKINTIVTPSRMLRRPQ